MSIMSFAIRSLMGAGDRKRDKGLEAPEDVFRFDDIAYEKASKEQVLDVYKPLGKKDEVLPVIINVHGGGWVYGDKNLYQFYCMSLAQKGFAIINFSYRLAPKHKHPAQLEDIGAVVEWMFKNYEKYGFDLKHVFMVGDSAGAHLSSLYSAICTNPSYRENYPQIQIPQQFVPTALALNCGVYNVEDMASQKGINKILFNDLLGKSVKDDVYAGISPVRHITKDFPPVYLMTAKGDFMLTQAPAMKEALEKNNVQHTYKVYGTEEKKLYHVFHCNMREPDGLLCNEEECEFFKSFL